MIDRGATGWPAAELPPIARLRVLAAALPNVRLAERVFPVPYPQVWATLADLEHSVPRFDQDVVGFQLEGDVTGGRARVRTRFGLTIAFTVTIADGLILVSARRLYLVGMAAEPVGADGTRYAQLEGVPTRLGRVARWRLERHLDGDLAGLERLVTNAGPPP